MEGKIYKVINTVDEKVYIGSTFQKNLSSRMGNHRTKARMEEKGSMLYSHMRAIGIDHFNIVLIKKVIVEDKDELEKEEFNEMQKIPKEQLLNMNREHGKRCAEHVQKCADARRGDKSPLFKRGSIFRITEMKGKWMADIIVFRWQDNGKQRQSCFSVKKYGLEEANRLAKAKQDEIYPK